MKLALVTGGTRGIGLAVARRLAQDGFAVTVTYAHDATQAEQTVAAARAEGVELAALRCDASSVEDWQKISQPGGFLDGKNIAVLVHAAGFTRDKLAMTMPVRDFDDVLGVHLRGGFLAAQAVTKGMIAARFGRILFICSPSAWLGRRGQTAYGAAKAGLFGLTKSLVQELSRFQITCNCVSAGLVDTALTADIPEPVRKELLASIPLGRPGTPSEVAELVAFLAAKEAGYITGQWLAADGGLDAIREDSF
ncbi:MAG TPA: SDR family oxidoreductase [Pseudomonadota bacterium]|nr:SDR family oxidoreductase [Pseudomonadota bacterium]